MKKTIIALTAVLSLGLSTAAFAEDKDAPTADPMSKIMNGLDLAIVSDTEYDIDTEGLTTEFGVEAGVSGLSLSLLPKYNWDTSEVDNIEVGLSYDWKFNKTFSVTPYGKYNLDSEFAEKGKTVGVKTRISF
jgi:hypothetical protein|tara:strand:- start:132 stop:527 length:396 start_codon:yes stop_codon:yes gene_type:complete